MPLLPRRSFPICISCYRAFTTTSASYAQLRKTELEPIPPELPPYPYGRAQWYKQSDKGLYGGQRIQFGNNVGQKSGTKTRRSWAVNVFRKRVFSKALNRFLQLRVSKKVLRTMDKVGGLDEYLLGEKEGRIKGLGMKGWELRWAIMQTPAIRARFQKERLALGMEDVAEEVERSEAEKRAAMELIEVMASEEPIELELDEAIEPNVDELIEEEILVKEFEDDGWQDIDTIGQVETTSQTEPPSYPRVRMAPKQFMMLTPRGWRTRPPRTQKSGEPSKPIMVERKLVPQTKVASAVLKSHSIALQKEGKTSMPGRQRRYILRQAKKVLKQKLEQSGELKAKFNEKMQTFELKTQREARLLAAKRKRQVAKARRANPKKPRTSAVN